MGGLAPALKERSADDIGTRYGTQEGVSVERHPNWGHDLTFLIVTAVLLLALSFVVFKTIYPA